MNGEPLHVRCATVPDQDGIASLLNQLGYASSAAEVGNRLNTIEQSTNDLVLVAVAADDMLGVISLHALPMFHANGFLGRITSLVVAEQARGKGVGGALMKAAEEWFLARQCVKIEVTSGEQRLAAHQFYQSHGLFQDGKRLSKALADPTAT